MSKISFYREKNFKKTEIGEIPREWKTEIIKNIGNIVTGKTPSTKVSEYWNGNIMFVTPTDYRNQKYISKTERYISSKAVGKDKLLPSYCVLTVCIASIGEVAINTQPCVTNQQINAIIPKRELIDIEFLFYTLKSYSNYLKQIAGFTTTPIIKKSTFENIKIPLPPLEEQKAIAKVLKDFDDLLENIEKQIKTLERIKKGLMNIYFTKGVFKHKTFKDTEIGRIPEGWEVGSLKDIFSEVNKNKRKVSIKQIDSPKFITVMLYAKGLKERIVKRIPKTQIFFKVKKGDFIYSKIDARHGAWGFVPPNLDGGLVSNDFPILELDKEKAYFRYIEFFLKQPKIWKKIKNFSSGSTNRQRIQPSLFLRIIKLPLPPLEEQIAIAERLKTIDDQIENLKKQKEHLQKIKKKFMDLLLTGKIRVKIHS